MGYPVSGAVVYLGNTRFRTTPDSSGMFSFSGIPVGTHSLFVQTDQMMHKQEGITISDNKWEEIEVTIDTKTDVDPLTIDNLLARVQDLEAEVRELKQKLKGVHTIQSPEYRLYTTYFVGDPEEREISTLNPGALQFNSEILPGGSTKNTITSDKPIKVIYEPGSVKGFETNFAGIDLGSQYSWMLFNDNPVLFTSYGTLLSPEKVITRGYWEITRIGDMLPGGGC